MVKLFSKKLKPAKKRGISTIVGGLIFLILLTTGFSAFYVALDVQIDTVDAQRIVSKSVIDKTQEKFAVSMSVDSNNILGINVKNQGSNPVEISNIWIINKSQTDEPAKSFDVNYEDAFIPSGYGSQILEKTPLYMNSIFGTDYDVKVVSTLGTIHKAVLEISNANILKSELFTIPPDVRTGENVTIAFRVTNAGDASLTNVQPFYDPSDETPSGAVVATTLVSSYPVELAPSETVVFTWHHTVQGAKGLKIEFKNYATATDPNFPTSPIQSNTATDKITLREDETSGSGETLVLTEDLFSKPEIFMIKPAPFGDASASSDTGLWGLNIANPTPGNMDITKLTISLLSPRSNLADQMFIGTGGGACGAIGISPPALGTWSCPSENQLMWKSYTPKTIPPFGVYSFLALAEPGKLGAGTTDLEAIIAHGSVFTNVGEFGKSGYGSSMRNADDAIVNVYMSDDVDTLNPAQINASMLQIAPEEIKIFNVTIADFSFSSTDRISAGARLIINVPKNFTDVTPINLANGFDWPIVKNTFSDGSTQLIGTLNIDLDDIARSIQFSAKAPDISTPKLYVMHVLADGKTANNFDIGPLAEIVLQVKP
jgi:hypothetical protein